MYYVVVEYGAWSVRKGKPEQACHGDARVVAGPFQTRAQAMARLREMIEG